MMSRPRKIRNKFYISLEDAYELNEHLKNIFANVTMFQSQGFLSQKLFTAFKYEYGTRLLNYGFSIQNGRVVVPDEAVEDIQTYVDMFVQKFRVKYSALLESEGFDYNPLDNVDIAENRDTTRTPNLSGSVTDTGTKSSTRTDNLIDKETRNLSDTVGGTATRTDNLSDLETRNMLDSADTTSERADDLTATTTYGKSLSTSDKTDYHSGIDTTTTTKYGKTETHNTTSDISTNSVVPYDSSNFSDREKNTHTDSSTITNGGTDTATTNQDNTGYDTKTGSETNSGSDTLTNTGTQTTTTGTQTAYTGTDEFRHTGTQGTETNTEETHTGTDEFKHTGTQQLSETNGLTRTTSSTGTETTDDDFTRTGFQPQYSISSRQDMIQKYRDVSNFSTVDIFLHDVADYILLSVFSTSPNLDCCLNNYL